MDWTDSFLHELRTTYRYATPSADRPRGSRLPRWLTTTRYHVDVLRIYQTARNQIRRGEFNVQAYARHSYNILHLVERVGGAVEISGLEHVARTPGAVVIVGNHMGSLETVLLPGLVLAFKDVAFVVKTSLMHHPVFGRIMQSVKAIAVARSNPRDDLREVLVQGTKFLKEGVSVTVFPQSTRRVEFDPGTFNSLGIKLAARAGVPVVPVAVKTDFQANGRLIKDLGIVDVTKKVHVKFGPPLVVTGNGRAEHESIIKFITDNLVAWGGRTTEAGAA
jgi:1-acyl-sn-glycerol-3-phosphate acyltransferase